MSDDQKITWKKSSSKQVDSDAVKNQDVASDSKTDDIFSIDDAELQNLAKRSADYQTQQQKAQGDSDEIASLQNDIQKLMDSIQTDEPSSPIKTESSKDSAALAAAMNAVEQKKKDASPLTEQKEEAPQQETEEEKQSKINSLKESIFGTLKGGKEDISPDEVLDENTQKLLEEKEKAKGMGETYFSDLADAMGSNKPATMSELLEKARFEKAEKKVFSPRSKKNMLYIAGTILVLAGIIWLLISLFRHKDVQVKYITDKRVQSLVYADGDMGINITGVSSEHIKQAIRKVLSTEIEKDKLQQVYYVQKDDFGNLRRIGVKQIFDATGVKAPQLLYDNIENTFMHGFYRSDKNYPFIILKALSYDRALQGMKEWEPRMIDDLMVYLNLPNEAGDRSLMEDGFSDALIKNKTARVARFLPRNVDKRKGFMESVKNLFGGGKGDKQDNNQNEIQTNPDDTPNIDITAGGGAGQEAGSDVNQETGNSTVDNTLSFLGTIFKKDILDPIQFAYAANIKPDVDIKVNLQDKVVQFTFHNDAPTSYSNKTVKIYGDLSGTGGIGNELLGEINWSKGQQTVQLNTHVDFVQYSTFGGSGSGYDGIYILYNSYSGHDYIAKEFRRSVIDNSLTLSTGGTQTNQQNQGIQGSTNSISTLPPHLSNVKFDFATGKFSGNFDASAFVDELNLGQDDIIYSDDTSNAVENAVKLGVLYFDDGSIYTDIARPFDTGSGTTTFSTNGLTDFSVNNNDVFVDYNNESKKVDKIGLTGTIFDGTNSREFSAFLPASQIQVIGNNSSQSNNGSTSGSNTNNSSSSQPKKFCYKVTYDCTDFTGKTVTCDDNDPTQIKHKIIHNKDTDQVFPASYDGRNGYECFVTVNGGDAIDANDVIGDRLDTSSTQDIVCYEKERQCVDEYGKEASYDPTDPKQICHYLIKNKKSDQMYLYDDLVGLQGYTKDYIKEHYACAHDALKAEAIGDTMNSDEVVCYPSHWECVAPTGKTYRFDDKPADTTFTCNKIINNMAPPVYGGVADSLKDHYICSGYHDGANLMDSRDEFEWVADLFSDWMMKNGDSLDKGSVLSRRNASTLEEKNITLPNGETISAMTLIQQVFAAIGAMRPDSVNGRYDLLTQRVIQGFQAVNGLNPTGMLDKDTLTLLNNIASNLGGIYGGSQAALINDYIIGGHQIGLGTYSEDVEKIQVLLFSEGYTISDFDGVFDDEVCNAVKQFNQDTGQELADEDTCVLSPQIIAAFNKIIKDKNYLGSGFMMNGNGYLVGTGILKGKNGPGAIGFEVNKAEADSLKEGDIVLLYTFLDEKTILIARDESVIHEIIKRRALKDIFYKEKGIHVVEK